MTVIYAVPEVGQIVRVRQRLYLVEGLVAPPRPQDSTLVELSCVEDDAQGQSLEVLWERELDAAVLTGEEWARIAQRVSADIKHPQFCRFCRSAPPSAWAGTR
jgi:hypothetical protein